MKRVNLLNPYTWYAIFELPALFNVSRATVYRSLKRCEIRAHRLYGFITVIYACDVYKLYLAPWFSKYVEAAKNIPVDHSIDSEYQKYEYSAKELQAYFHEPQEICDLNLLPITHKTLNELVSVGFIPTVNLNHKQYLLPWFYKMLIERSSYNDYKYD